MIRFGPRLLVLAFLCLPASGCTRWQVENTSPVNVLQSKPKAVRVERMDGTVVELVRPETAGDTLTGLVPGSAPPGTPLQRVAIPFDEISRLASRRADMRRTVAGALAAPLAYFAGGFMMRW
jgi:hypothetical protein